MATATCNLQPDDPKTIVPVNTKVKVRYQFVTGTTPDLALPYAVAINGKCLPEYAHQPRSLTPSKRTIDLVY